MPSTARDVLDFWFQELKPKDRFTKNELIDREIERRFGATLKAAAKSELFEWRTSAEGRLAEIIVLDQFSRNIFRDHPSSFAQDPLALALSQEMVRLTLDRKIQIEQRVFVYMPYMHSELSQIHTEAIKLFSEPGLEENLKFELRHKEIINRFGRFPHRNRILGRESTREEKEFLMTPNSSF